MPKATQFTAETLIGRIGNLACEEMADLSDAPIYVSTPGGMAVVYDAEVVWGEDGDDRKDPVIILGLEPT